MKYKLLENDTIKIGDKTLYRIQAVKGFGYVKDGDLGGYIESYKNLSQSNNCWVDEEACVYEDAWVTDNAVVAGNADIFGHATIASNANVYECAKIFGSAIICGHARVFGSAVICEYAKVFGNAVVYNNAKIYNYGKVWNNAVVRGDAKVYGKGSVCGSAEILGNAEVSDIYDYVVFMNWWSSGRWFTYTRSNKMWKVGCFYGTGDELIAKAYKDSEVSGKEYERVVKYVENCSENMNRGALCTEKIGK